MTTNLDSWILEIIHSIRQCRQHLVVVMNLKIWTQIRRELTNGIDSSPSHTRVGMSKSIQYHRNNLFQTFKHNLPGKTATNEKMAYFGNFHPHDTTDQIASCGLILVNSSCRIGNLVFVVPFYNRNPWTKILFITSHFLML